MVHELKIHKVYLDAIIRGTKKYELRRNDRGFKVGDTLHLKEFNPTKGSFTGREIKKKVNHILTKETFGLKEGYCVMCWEDE